MVKMFICVFVWRVHETLNPLLVFKVNLWLLEVRLISFVTQIQTSWQQRSIRPPYSQGSSTIWRLLLRCDSSLLMFCGNRSRPEKEANKGWYAEFFFVQTRTYKSYRRDKFEFSSSSFINSKLCVFRAVKQVVGRQYRHPHTHWGDRLGRVCAVLTGTVRLASVECGEICQSRADLQAKGSESNSEPSRLHSSLDRKSVV